MYSNQGKSCWVIRMIVFIALIGGCLTKPQQPNSQLTIMPSTHESTQITQEFALETANQQIESQTDIPAPPIDSQWIRPSAIAGSWYPDDPEELTNLIDGFLDAVSPIDGDPLALIVPHAGYIYSGPVAATGFKQLEDIDLEVAVIIASDHQAPLSAPISVWSKGGFETPLGVVRVHQQIAEKIIASDPIISFDPAAHEGEHPIEIQLPFLQRVCQDCSIVPILMSDDSERTVNQLARALSGILLGEKAVIIASTDLSHYPNYEDAQWVDASLLWAIESGKSPTVRETISSMMTAGIENLVTCACGQGPILVAMQVAEEFGTDTISVLRYANSGDSPYGDQTKVVGYGALMFWDYKTPELSQTTKEELIDLARGSIKEYLETEKIPDLEIEDESLTRLSSAFVTLKMDGILRGCIGHMRADRPLYQVVQEMAVAAATADSRFQTLTEDEIEKVKIEISILSPLKRVRDINEIQIGIHGLMIMHQGGRGVLLPQVPLEQGWNLEQYLDNLCLKAGLASDCWLDQPDIYSFTALVFDGE